MTINDKLSRLGFKPVWKWNGWATERVFSFDDEDLSIQLKIMGVSVVTQFFLTYCNYWKQNSIWTESHKSIFDNWRYRSYVNDLAAG